MVRIFRVDVARISRPTLNSKGNHVIEDNRLLGHPLFRRMTKLLGVLLITYKARGRPTFSTPTTHNQLESWIDTSSLSVHRHRPSQWGGLNTSTAVDFWIYPLSWLIIFRTATENIQQSSGNFSGTLGRWPQYVILTVWRDCTHFLRYGRHI